jgi:thiol-disulfide isomerase/thioredoxin
VHSKIIFLILLPLVLFYLPVHIFLEDAQVSLPSSASHFVGILFGVFIYNSDSFLQKAFYQLGVFLICLLMFVKGYDMWIHKINYGTFSSEMLMKAPIFHFENEYGGIITNQDFKNKMVVLDFWTTSCGACFKKFPTLEALYSKVASRSDIKIYSVNNPLKDDNREESIRMIRERGYLFPIRFGSKKENNDQLNFNGYPTVFEVANGSEIIYKGDIENVESILKLN